MRYFSLIIVFGAVCVFLAAMVNRNGEGRAERHIKALKSEIAEKAQMPAKHDSASMASFIKAFELEKEEISFIDSLYQEVDSQIIWFNASELKPEFKLLVNRAENASEHGLFPEEYDYEALKRFAATYEDDNLQEGITTPNEIKEVDLLASLLFYQYASDLTKGRINPAENGIRWPMLEKYEPLDKTLLSILQDGQGGDPFVVLEPESEFYDKLQAALAAKRQEKGDYDWLTLDSITLLKQGDTSTTVIAVKQRLRFTGDYAGAMNDSVFNDELKTAVLSFQKTRGLSADGIIGPNTLAALQTVDVEGQIEKLAINMERLRWTPDNLGEKYLFVNLPEYRLHVYEDGVEVLTMKNISGKPVHATPVFHDTLQYIVFSPYWNVPRSIATNEILPALQRNPSYLYGENMVAYTEHGRQISPYSVNWDGVSKADFNYRFRQRPGAGNALGLVKFLFPNNYKIYMHDTPAKSLFNNEMRAFSHGCIRLEQPFELAKYLLRDYSEWDDHSILNAMWAGKEKWVTLEQKVPVFIMYYTAFPDKNGEVAYYDDVYGYDEKLKAVYFDVEPVMNNNKIAAF